MRRSTGAVLATIMCVGITGTVQVQAAVPETALPVAAGERGRAFGAAVAQLRADADSTLRIHTGRSGLVDFVGSPSGLGVDNPSRVDTAGPVASARAHTRRYAAMFGIDAPAEDLGVLDQTGRPEGGSLVRMRQNVDGVPVLGGELVVAMDPAGDLTSIVAETTRARRAAAPAVGEPLARRTAVRVAAKTHSVPAQSLHAGAGEPWLYDPAILGVEDPLGARTVWRFEVGNGYDVRELVLVDARTGRLALHFNQVHEVLNRVVCDNANALQPVPMPPAREPRCNNGFARTENGPASAVSDVNQAFVHSGATSRLYDDVSNIDLTRMIGISAGGARRLASTVNWCFVGQPCPMPNAFWNGVQMYYGDGFAAGDDVVGHELTHGVIDHTSRLFYFHQSGAINESLADIMGEIVDHRFPSPGDSAGNWNLGEAVPGGRIRNLRNPPSVPQGPGIPGQPDRMRSRLWFANPSLDNGGVHINSGVGNKTAYLISQGGRFNGRRIAGIDGANRQLTRSAVLWVSVMRRLVSGSDYADLGRVLVQTCNELAASTASFRPVHCFNVGKAVAATQLSLQPANRNAAAPEAPATCPRRTVKRVLFRDNVESRRSWNLGVLWRRAPFAREGIPPYATSGTRSFFGYDPDPALGDPSFSPLTMGRLVRLPRRQRSFLHFRHAHQFEFTPSTFFDGGLVRVRNVRGRPFRGTTDLPWVNGPKDLLRHGEPSLPNTGFGGISNGYVSSRLSLSSMAGRRVQLQWVVAGDAALARIGWFLDDVEIYTCGPRRAGGR